jgi:hypothetical protein
MLSKTLITAGVGSKVFTFKDLLPGDILTANNGSKYVVPGITGNGVLNSDLAFTVLSEDFKNPHANSAGGLNIATIDRLDATPGIELLSEAFRFVAKGIKPKWDMYRIWANKTPAQLAAEKAVADAEAASAKATKALADAQARLRSYR